MIPRAARFEIVTTGSRQHHARYIAPNGRIVWTTETYTQRKGAENAIESLAASWIQWVKGSARIGLNRHVEVRYIDERLHRVARPGLPELAS